MCYSLFIICACAVPNLTVKAGPAKTRPAGPLATAMPSWCTYNLYSMLLAIYAILIKNPQVSVYTAVLTYVAMVFCPIQHILEAL